MPASPILPVIFVGMMLAFLNLGNLFLLMAFSFTFIWYCWREYSPYFSFTNYWVFNWQTIVAFLREKGPNNEPVAAYFFQRLTGILKKHMAEGMVVLWFPKPVLCIFSPESIKFFSNDPSLTDKPRWVYQIFDIVIKGGLLTSNGKRWKKQRKLVSPAFYPRMMKYFEPIMTKHAAHFVQELSRLENNTAENLIKIVKSRLLVSSIEGTLGDKSDTAEMDGKLKDFINTALKEFVHMLFKPWLSEKFLRHYIRSNPHYKNLVEAVKGSSRQLVEDLKKSYSLRHQSMASNNIDPHLHEEQYKSLGEALIEEHLKDPSFTIEDIRVNVLTLIFADYDTLSYTLTWSLWLIGLHQEIQEKAFEEIQSVTGEDILYEDISNLTFLECIVKESLRLYTIIPIFARQTRKDCHFGKHTIPSGTTIAFLPYVLHRNPDVYPDPEIFNPDRFVENNLDITPWNYVPFAEGVRPCIGKKYAMLEMKIYLAHVIRRFKIVSLTPREDVTLAWESTLKSTKPLSVKFIPR